MFYSDELADRIAEATQAPATLFVKDGPSGDFIRRATNMRNPDGSRAVGTAMDRNGVVFPHRVRAAAPMWARPKFSEDDYLLVNLPVFGRSGQVLGVLGSGFQVTALEASASRLMWQMGMVSLAAVLVLTLAAILSARMLFRPIPKLAETMKSLAHGETAADGPLSRLEERDRRDGPRRGNLPREHGGASAALRRAGQTKATRRCSAP